MTREYKCMKEALRVPPQSKGVKTFTPKISYLNSLDFLSAGELLKDQKGKEILVRFRVRLLI